MGTTAISLVPISDTLNPKYVGYKSRVLQIIIILHNYPNLHFITLEACWFITDEVIQVVVTIYMERCDNSSRYSKYLVSKCLSAQHFISFQSHRGRGLKTSRIWYPTIGGGYREPFHRVIWVLYTSLYRFYFLVTFLKLLVTFRNTLRSTLRPRSSHQVRRLICESGIKS